jgi:hypothetical protein
LISVLAALAIVLPQAIVADSAGSSSAMRSSAAQIPPAAPMRLPGSAVSAPPALSLGSAVSAALGTPDPGVVASPSGSPSPAVVPPQPATVAPASVTVPSDGRWHYVDVGGRRLAITCKGKGTPIVILEHGLGYGVNSGSWATVEAGVAKTTRVCRYDRAFVGHSDDARSGRSMPDLAADLLALLSAGGLPGPHVLVGHSFGGLSVRFYALLHPDDVAGMVLVDGSPPAAITNLDLSSERLNRPRVLAQLKLLKSLGSIPLVVITRGIGLSPSWRAAQVAMAHLSTNGRQVIATRSDHWIQLRQPEVVIREINSVIAAVRRRT